MKNAGSSRRFCISEYKILLVNDDADSAAILRILVCVKGYAAAILHLSNGGCLIGSVAGIVSIHPYRCGVGIGLISDHRISIRNFRSPSADSIQIFYGG